MADKLDLNELIPEGWQGKYPPCLIQVNKEGEFFHNGAKMIHPKIIELVFDSVYFEDDLYLLKMNNQICQLEVADTFYVVRDLDLAEGSFLITLNDNTQEELDPQTLRIGKQDVIYCRVKNGVFPARFLRSSYYRLAEYIKETDQGFALDCKGKLCHIKSLV